MKKIIVSLLAVSICAALAACSGIPVPPISAQEETKTASETSSAQPAASAAPSGGASLAEAREMEEAVNTERGDPARKAILIVSFGTSYNDTRALTLDAIEAAAAQAFPDYEVRRAFTSQMIIDKLAKRDGLEIDNVTQAMERLVADGFGTVICQPTHVMHGLEYDDMMREVGAFAPQIESLSYGEPLLSSSADYAAVSQILYTSFAPPADTALVVMGHGTTHFADAAYAALDYRFKDDGHPNMMVGTVEGFPTLESVKKQLKAGGYRRVILAPMMIVAGDHATKDMAGDEEGSWKVALREEGYEVEPVLRGLGEYPAIQELYVAHIDEAIRASQGAVQ